MSRHTLWLVTLVAAFLALLCLSGCSSGGAAAAAKKNGSPTAAASARNDSVSAPAPGAVAKKPSTPSGPAIQVTWEALAREKYLLENSRFKRRGPQPPQKIILYSRSHPDAKRVLAGRGSEDGAQSAVLDDQDMVAFLKGLERQGFFRLARPAGFDSSLVSSDSARGRVTVVRDGQGYTLISVRGQGLNQSTKAIPKLYSEAKQAIMTLRNMNPTLSVSQYGASGKARTR
jgi:hypothetical protein